MAKGIYLNDVPIDVFVDYFNETNNSENIANTPVIVESKNFYNDVSLSEIKDDSGTTVVGLSFDTNSNRKTEGYYKLTLNFLIDNTTGTPLYKATSFNLTEDADETINNNTRSFFEEDFVSIENLELYKNVLNAKNDSDSQKILMGEYSIPDEEAYKKLEDEVDKIVGTDEQKNKITIYNLLSLVNNFKEFLNTFRIEEKGVLNNKSYRTNRFYFCYEIETNNVDIDSPSVFEGKQITSIILYFKNNPVKYQKLDVNKKPLYYDKDGFETTESYYRSTFFKHQDAMRSAFNNIESRQFHNIMEPRKLYLINDGIENKVIYIDKLETVEEYSLVDSYGNSTLNPGIIPGDLVTNSNNKIITTEYTYHDVMTLEKLPRVDITIAAKELSDLTKDLASINTFEIKVPKKYDITSLTNSLKITNNITDNMALRVYTKTSSLKIFDSLVIPLDNDDKVKISNKEYQVYNTDTDKPIIYIPFKDEKSLLSNNTSRSLTLKVNIGNGTTETINCNVGDPVNGNFSKIKLTYNTSSVEVPLYTEDIFSTLGYKIPDNEKNNLSSKFFFILELNKIVTIHEFDMYCRLKRTSGQIFKVHSYLDLNFALNNNPNSNSLPTVPSPSDEYYKNHYAADQTKCYVKKTVSYNYYGNDNNVMTSNGSNSNIKVPSGINFLKNSDEKMTFFTGVYIVDTTNLSKNALVPANVFKNKRKTSFRNSMKYILNNKLEGIDLPYDSTTLDSNYRIYNYCKGINNFVNNDNTKIIKEEKLKFNLIPSSYLAYNMILSKEKYEFKQTSSTNNSSIGNINDDRNLLTRIAAYKKYPLSYKYEKELESRLILEDEDNFKTNNNVNIGLPQSTPVKNTNNDDLTNQLHDYIFNDIIRFMKYGTVSNMQTLDFENNLQYASKIAYLRNNIPQSISFPSTEKKVFSGDMVSTENLLRDLLLVDNDSKKWEVINE